MEHSVESNLQEQYEAPAIRDLGSVAEVTLGGIGLFGETLTEAPHPTQQTST